MTTAIDSLINNSIRIDSEIQLSHGMMRILHQLSPETCIDVSKAVLKVTGFYALNNSTVAFIYDDIKYVTPYTNEVIQTLEDNGFIKKQFYVPFCNGDVPEYFQYKWKILCNRAKASYSEEFIRDCINYCDINRIAEISDETLKKCFKMPNDGVKIKHFGIEDCYYPVIKSDCMDCTVAENLGTYCTNNGCVVFVYRDSCTYVTKGNIVSELQEAGYKKNNMFVPFSNGEEIQDYYFKMKWNSISM